MTQPAAGQPRRRVLLVDDDDLVLRSLARVLRREFDVLTAVDAADAIAKTVNDLYAVISDHDLLPGKPNGRAVLAEVRRRAPDTRRILMSGRAQSPHAGEEDLWQMFLTKPVARADLFTALGLHPSK